MKFDYWLAASLVGLFVLLIGLYFFRRSRMKRAGQKEMPPPVIELPEAQVPAQVLPPTEAIEREPELIPARRHEPILAEKLSRTRGSLLGRLGKFLGKTATADSLKAEWNEVEEALLEGDVGIRTTELLLQRVTDRLKSAGQAVPLRDAILEESEALLSGLDHGAPNLETLPKPYVISVVGVNGAGKTTSIGKLAQRFINEGKTVLVGAADTFRAAAIGQLKVWAERTGAQFVTGREGGDPGAVAFDSLSAGKARGVDVVLVDTAGRLHTKTNLMDELAKVHRVMKKVIPEAPHEIWLVVDGTTGQNAVRQAQEFQKTLALTGVIITKLDGTAKGGAILSVASELKLPIKFIGVGETVEDLIPFEPKPFVEAILGGK